MVLGKLESHMQKNETKLLSDTTNKKLKWIKDLNISLEIIKYVGKNIGIKLRDLGLRLVFVILTSKAREVKTKTNEWNYIKLKSFCTTKETNNKTKTQQPNGRRYLQTALTRG